MRLCVPIFASLIFVTAARAATFGTVTAPPGGAAYTDSVLDERQQRLYLVNNGQSRIDVCNIRTRAFLSPIATDLQPVSAAISTDGNTLDVTCYASAALDLIDLTQNLKSGSVSLPSSPEG
jgi:DNA-binding beta-propeller fold protein YncE